MSTRKYPLDELARVRSWILDGENFIPAPTDKHKRKNYRDIIYWYFKAFGEKVKITGFGDDQLYIRMENK